MQALIASNDDMRSELAKLNSTVQRLVHDNKELQAGQKISNDKFSKKNSAVGLNNNNLETGAGLRVNEAGSMKEKMPPRNVTREAVVGSPKFYRPNVYI